MTIVLVNNHLHADVNIEVAASPLDVNETQRWVTVSWKNVPNPSKLDWIGLWSLYRWPVITPDKQAPIKYQVGMK